MELKKKETDSLALLNDVGANRASKALAALLHRKVDVSMTKVRHIPIGKVPSIIGGGKVKATGTIFAISGSISGYMMMICPTETSVSLLRMLGVPCRSKKIDDDGEDTLKEIGNILIGNYLAALSDLSKLNLVESVPHLVVSDAQDIIEQMMDVYDVKLSDVLVIDTTLHIDGGRFSQELVLILDSKEFRKLISSLTGKR